MNILKNFNNISESSNSISKEASKYDNWVKAMKCEMEALEINNTWDLVKLPKNRKSVGSK